MKKTFADAFSLKGHVALITGGAGGLGFAIAQCFISAGANVIISGVNEEKMAKARSELGDKASAIRFDVTQADEAEAFAAKLETLHGPISILVNNAGNTVKKPIEEMTVADFKSVLDVHVVGAFALTRAFLPQLKKTGRGSVLFTASMASFLGIPQVLGYVAAKSAYVGMVRALSSELAGKGVRVNGLAPGWIDTPLLQSTTANDPDRLAKIMARIPMQEIGVPEDVGWAMAFLASDAARYISGQILAVDGGALHAL